MGSPQRLLIYFYPFEFGAPERAANFISGWQATSLRLS
jgi:hypothetical protein